MREYTSKVDKLEESENLRQTEEKEAEYKPVAMGEPNENAIFALSEYEANF